MSTLEQQLRTRTLARVLGPFFVIVAATTVAVHRICEHSFRISRPTRRGHG